MTKDENSYATRKYLADLAANYAGRSWFLAALIPFGLMFALERLDWFVILAASTMFVVFVLVGVLLRRRARRLRRGLY